MQSWLYWHNKWNIFTVYSLMDFCDRAIRDAKVCFPHSLPWPCKHWEASKSSMRPLTGYEGVIILKLTVMLKFSQTLAPSYGAVCNSCGGLIGLCLQLRVSLSVFKPGMHWPQAWFLKIVFVQTSVYVCVCVCMFVCVSAPKAINN